MALMLSQITNIQFFHESISHVHGRRGGRDGRSGHEKTPTGVSVDFIVPVSLSLRSLLYH